MCERVKEEVGSSSINHFLPNPKKGDRFLHFTHCIALVFSSVWLLRWGVPYAEGCVILSTGWNQTANATLAIGSVDPNWSCSVAGYNKATLPFAGFWAASDSPLAPSLWLSQIPPFGPAGNYTYTSNFSSNMFDLTLDIVVDEIATTSLNGNHFFSIGQKPVKDLLM